MLQYTCPECGKVITAIADYMLKENIEAHKKLHGLNARKP